MIDKIINNLPVLNQDEWNRYIFSLCTKRNPIPSLKEISADLFSKLAWIYNTLDKTDKLKLDLFMNSIIQVLRTIPQTKNNAQTIYLLIYFIHEIKPIRHRSELELLIRDKLFTELYYGSDNLHLLLVKAYIHVENNKELYIEEHINNYCRDVSEYTTYLLIYYYSYLGKPEKALEIILINFESDIPNDRYSELFNALIDCIPQYIDFKKIITYLIRERSQLKFSRSIYFKNTIDSFIKYLKENFAQTSLVYFLEDILKENKNNFLNVSYQKDFFLKNSENKEIYQLISNYYGTVSTNDSMKNFNEGNLDDIANTIITTVDNEIQLKKAG